jgi:outer membrane protein TolC
VFELLGAKRRQLEAEVRYVETLREHWVAAAALAKLLAGGLPDALRAGGHR